MNERELRALRSAFPILNTRFGNKPLIYFDNAATTQKPRSVLEACNQFYRRSNANVHRASYQLARDATDAYESARTRIAEFLSVDRNEIVWTSGTTEGVNLIAQSYLAPRLKPGDRILLARSNHHANILPWQQISLQHQAQLDVLELDEAGNFDQIQYAALLEREPVLVALSHVSNVLGTVYPIEQMIPAAQAAGAAVVIDGAQALPHFPIDLRQLGADFYLFSGHKLFGPTGIGVLWGKREVLEQMPPWKTGGEMIEQVSFERSTFAPPPQRFEAGTPNIAGALGLAEAVRFLSDHSSESLANQEFRLQTHLLDGLESLPGIRTLGAGEKRVSLVSFTHERVHAQDIALLLDQEGIAVRAGMHCAEPLYEALKIDSSVRASLAFYNTLEEVDRFIETLDLSLTPSKQGLGRSKAEVLTTLNAAKNWSERYAALLELGDLSEQVDPELRQQCYRVPGCESRVWMKFEQRDGRVHLKTDSDARILRGLLIWLTDQIDQQKGAVFDRDALEQRIEQLGFSRHLSRSRGNALIRLLEQLETNFAELA